MAEPPSTESRQIRPPGGMAFWSFSAEMLRDLTIEEHFARKVRWRGREWICKQDERTLNEVVGYQIASKIGLPLQPWLAFESPAPQSIGVGMFIEWWTSAHRQSSLVGLGTEQATLVARGLAFWVFGRDEWPEWLLSKNTSDLRLIDLDGTGPALTVPPREDLLNNYLESTEYVFHTARSHADQCGISKAFSGEVDRLTSIDFSGLVDLCGYSSERTLTEMMLSGLKTRQATVRDYRLHA